MNTENLKISIPFGPFIYFGLILVILKLTNVITLSWWLVLLLPFALQIGALCGFGLISFLVLVVGAFIKIYFQDRR